MYGEENIIRSDPHRQTTYLHCGFIAVDQARESIGERRDRRQKNAQDAKRNFLSNARRCLALNLHVWSRRKQFNGLDQKLYEYYDASKEREDKKLCDNEDYVKTKN